MLVWRKKAVSWNINTWKVLSDLCVRGCRWSCSPRMHKDFMLVFSAWKLHLSSTSTIGYFDIASVSYSGSIRSCSPFCPCSSQPWNDCTLYGIAERASESAPCCVSTDPDPPLSLFWPPIKTGKQRSGLCFLCQVPSKHESLSDNLAQKNVGGEFFFLSFPLPWEKIFRGRLWWSACTSTSFLEAGNLFRGGRRVRNVFEIPPVSVARWDISGQCCMMGYLWSV